MLRKSFFLYLITILFINNPISISIENKILAKVENQIITSVDVDSEYKYLIALNPNLKNSKKKEVLNLSKISVIKERIKKIEIDKNFNNPKITEEFLDQILINIYTKIGLNNLDEFKNYLEINGINFENVRNKLIIEALWNELIYIKFSSKININENKIKNRIQKNNNKFIKSYLMSEIFFEISNLNDLNNKFSEISNTIKDKGFEFAAIKYSSSSTSKLGGKLDWINENSLNKNIKQSIKNLEINNFTQPIIVPGGFLILKINDIRDTKIEVNIDNEIKKLINFEKNNQLNQYSKIYFNKIKKDLEISGL